jgi:hypothetical protein
MCSLPALNSVAKTFQAMIIAHEKSKSYGSLLSRVHAAVFFGVPHRGSDSAYWAYFAARLLEFGQLGFGTNSTYVSALRRNSKTFADISQQFIDRGPCSTPLGHTMRPRRWGIDWYRPLTSPAHFCLTDSTTADCRQRLCEIGTSERDCRWNRRVESPNNVQD